MLAVIFAGSSGLVPGSTSRSAVTRPATFDRRDFAGLAAASVFGLAAPAFAEEEAKKEEPKEEAGKPKKEKESKGPPPNLGGPPMAKQDSALGIVSYSKMPQFRDSKGKAIPDFKVAKLGKLDPKVARPQFNK